ncbi:MAG: hypothetical protein AAGA95_17455, partial [Pseudomonadota bacterium]
MKTLSHSCRNAFRPLAISLLVAGTLQSALQAANDVDAGFRHSVTIIDYPAAPVRDGFWGWGRNGFGQLGDAALGTPVTVGVRTDDRAWEAVASGDQHSIAILGGVLYVVGNNQSGQLGLSILDPVDTFTELTNGGFDNTAFTAVAAGDFHTLALKGGTGELWAFGSDVAGQLGNDAVSASSSTPVQVTAPDGQPWVAIAAGGNQSLGITGGGRLYAWGSHIEGQLGVGTIQSLQDRRRLEPTQVGTALTRSLGGAAAGRESREPKADAGRRHLHLPLVRSPARPPTMLAIHQSATALKCALGSSLIVALAAATLTAQQGASRNATLLSRFDPTNSYNDIWGYVAPNGKEYALLAASNGTYVVDCSNPRAPVQRGFISGPSACCRDIRTYQTYAYVVNDGGGGGVQIIDLSNPDQPRLLRTYRTSQLNSA